LYSEQDLLHISVSWPKANRGFTIASSVHVRTNDMSSKIFAFYSIVLEQRTRIISSGSGH